MIITTSGSSAGIGFAVPGDNVKESTDHIVEMDKERQLRLTTRKGRGWIGVDVAMNYLEDSFCKRLVQNVNETGLMGAFVTAIDVNSPLLHTQDTNDVIKITSVVNGRVVIGDRIIKVGGTDIANGRKFANEMKNRIEGEQITLTVANEDGNTRIIYIKLGRIPL
jgi:S1-C subfamily serine protease